MIAGIFPIVRKEKVAHISLSLSCFAPTIEMRIVIPPDRDEEEYIDEILDSILDEEFRYNCEWDFI